MVIVELVSCTADQVIVQKSKWLYHSFGIVQMQRRDR